MESSTVSRRTFMKGALATGGAALAAASLAACAPATDSLAETGDTEGHPARAFSFTPGVYHGSAEGRGGDVTVAVTLSENAIEAVNITSHRETAIISDVPCSRIPREIVEYQSTAVDTVTGATMTSMAIIGAAENAIVASGASVDEVRASFDVAPVINPPLPEDVRIAVVGGGVAGMAAAIRAAQLEIPVVLFEQSAHLGGDALFADGWSFGAGTMMQKAAGIEDSPELMIQEYTVDRFNPESKNQWNEENFRKLVEGSGPTVDWLDSYVGARYDKRQVTRGDYGWDLTPRVTYLNGGYNLVEPMTRKIEEGVRDGFITVMFEHAVTGLTTDESGKVVGVETVNRNGESEDYAFDTVLMATGGFAHNAEMRAEFCGPNVQTYTPSTDNGSGYGIIEALGGSFVNMNATGFYGGALVTSGTDMVRYQVDCSYPYAFWVGKDGKRILNELISTKAHQMFWTLVPDNIGYVVFPASKRLEQNGIVEKCGYCETPLTPWQSWELFDKLLDEGKGVWQADTIEELAEKMGVDAAGLAQTADEISAAYSAGEADSFGRTSLCDMTGPFYGLEAYAYLIFTAALAEVDIDYRMLTADGAPIEGLRVAGQLLGTQLPPTTKTQGGNGLSGSYPNQGRMAMEAIIEELYGIDAQLPPFSSTADPSDYDIEIAGVSL